MFDCLERWEKDLNAKWINNVIEKFTYTSSLHFHSTTIFFRFYLYGSQHAFFSLNQMNINNIFFSFMHAQNPLSNWTTCVLFFSYSAKPKWLNVNSLILPVDEPNEKKFALRLTGLVYNMHFLAGIFFQWRRRWWKSFINSMLIALNCLYFKIKLICKHAFNYLAYKFFRPYSTLGCWFFFIFHSKQNRCCTMHTVDKMRESEKKSQ